MSPVTAFVRAHPVCSYFVLAFTISWGGLLVLGGPDLASGTTWQSDPRLPFLVLAMLAGPSLAGLLLTALVSGRPGLCALGSRLLRWRVGARWYVIALLTAPVVFAAVHLALSFTSPVFLPSIFRVTDNTSLLVSSIAGALLVGFFEELGWTGFAIPRLRLRYSVFATGLAVGLPWGAWHLLTNDVWIASSYSGGLPVALFVTVNGLSLLIGQLPAYRVLMVWVYDQTGSLLIAMLMHASLSACTFILGPPATGPALLIYGFVLAAAWWIVVAVVATATDGQLSRQPHEARESDSGRRRVPIAASPEFERFAQEAQFRDRIAIVVKASPDAIFQALREVALRDMRLAWALGAIRYLPSRVSGRLAAADSTQPFRILLVEEGTMILRDDSPHEVITGSAAQLHRVNQAPRRFTTREAFDAFHGRVIARNAAKRSECEGAGESASRSPVVLSLIRSQRGGPDVEYSGARGKGPRRCLAAFRGRCRASVRSCSSRSPHTAARCSPPNMGSVRIHRR